MSDTSNSEFTLELTPLVETVLEIEDITWGNPGSESPIDDVDGKVLVRYRGRLLVENDRAYDLLTAQLRPHKITPLFQTNGDREAIYLIRDEFTTIVSEVMKIEETSWRQPEKGSGRPSQYNYLVRYKGTLLLDSMTAYDLVAERLKPYKITPLFRNADRKHEVVLVDWVISAKPSNPRINLLLFILTVFTVLLSGTMYSYQGPAPTSLSDLAVTLISNLHLGIPFAVSLLAILLAHEFGHYLAGRYHRTAVTLPYFIPFPTLLGTLGAFIQIKEPPKNKRILLDIGAAGPLAGLVVAVPVLILGLSLSELGRIPFGIAANQSLTLEGNSILYLAAKYLIFGELLPMPANYGNLPPLLFWLRYFFTGQPAPLGGVDVMISPVAWAGWAGLLVTGLNLIPAGQLDGGHLMHTLLGKKARYLLPFILASLVILGFFWTGWWLWAALIFILGRYYIEPLDQITKLDRRRKWVAILGLIIFILVFMPVPLQIIPAAGFF